MIDAMQYYEIGRVNMVKSQISVHGITDEAILNAFGDINRHAFVEGKFQKVAYSDARLPVSENRDLLSSAVFARMIAAAKINSEDVVLDVACATGYSTAILAKLAKSVVGLENNTDLATKAAHNIIASHLHNVSIKNGEIIAGAPENGPYDVIMINGALDVLPENLVDQLKENGRLLYIKVISKHLHYATLCIKSSSGLIEEYLFDTWAKNIY